MADTLLFHDYETWGVRPSVDFPVQFAAVRTDLDLNIIETQVPINWMCAIPQDYLPHPKACLVTGLTPPISIAKGMSEPVFAEKVHRQLSMPKTCTVGYNSMRFDEEVSRHLLFRNFYSVYDREYKNGNSRWDIIDLVRACYALRPDGINWPQHSNGKPSFKLEDLSQANDISHEAAHDALSDVYATIAIAKLIKQKQRKLYAFYWGLRDKSEAAKYLQRFMSTVFVHVSGYINSEQGCCTLIMPICRHPDNANAVLCIDLLKPIDDFVVHCAIGDKVASIQDALFSRNLLTTKSNQERPGLISIAVNKSPFIAPLKTLDTSNAERLGISIESALKNAEILRQQHDLVEVCQAVYTKSGTQNTINNIDEALYAIGFPAPADTQLMDQIRECQPEQLVGFQGRFENPLYEQLLFRYRARNFPYLLEESEVKKWQGHLQARFTQSNKKECLSIDEYFIEIEELIAQHQQKPSSLQILQILQRYGQNMLG